MKLRYMTLTSLSMLLLSGCGSDVTRPGSQTTKIRVINAVTNLDTTTAAGDKIDVLMDSSTTLEGGQGITVNTATPYTEIPAGVHSFVARIAGFIPPRETLFTDATSIPYLPKQYLTPATNYTFLATGIYPKTGVLPGGAIAPTIILDDPFAPPFANGKYQTRFKFINAAPYASGPTGVGATVLLYVTPGVSALSSVSGLRSQADAQYRRASIYVNVTDGTYVLTFAVGLKVVASIPVTLNAGEVRTFVLLNTGPGVAPTDPSPRNHAVLNLIDATI